MKTEKQFNELIKHEEDEIQFEIKDSAKKKRLEKINLYRHCIDYLKTNPSEGYLRKEIKRISDKVDKIMQQTLDVVPGYLSKQEFNKRVSALRKEHGLQALKKQLSVLRLIVDTNLP
jgi:arsenate reductase-like glutaredoxin family protein